MTEGWGPRPAPPRTAGEPRDTDRTWVHDPPWLSVTQTMPPVPPGPPPSRRELTRRHRSERGPGPEVVVVRTLVLAVLSVPVLLVATGVVGLKPSSPGRASRPAPATPVPRTTPATAKPMTAATASPSPAGPATLSLVALTPARASNGFGPPERNASNGEQSPGDGRRMRIDGRAFAGGWGVHAESSLEFALNERWRTFSTFVGVDDEAFGSVVAEVRVDGRVGFRTGVLHAGAPAQRITVDVRGARTLTLAVFPSDENNAGDHADWADPQLTR